MGDQPFIKKFNGKISRVVPSEGLEPILFNGRNPAIHKIITLPDISRIHDPRLRPGQSILYYEPRLDHELVRQGSCKVKHRSREKSRGKSSNILGMQFQVLNRFTFRDLVGSSSSKTRGPWPTFIPRVDRHTIARRQVRRERTRTIA